MSLKQSVAWSERLFLNNLTRVKLILLASLFITLSCNFSFFAHFSQEYVLGDNLVFVVVLGLIIFALITLLISIVQLLLPVKWAVTLVLLISVITAYFSDEFGVIIDIEMIRNSLQTDVAEAADLFTLSLLWRLLLLVALPVAMVAWLPLTKPSLQANWLVKLKSSAVLILVSVVLVALCVAAFSAQFSSFIREHKKLRYYINPIQALYSGGRYLTAQIRADRDTSYSLLSYYSEVPKTDPKRELIIMVVGETARADHFALNGYARPTTPLLSQEKNLINYPDISSCGTSTAISVPCMFSLAGREDFDIDSAAYTENAFDIIAKAGVSVLWRDNNSDSKGVAVRQAYEEFKSPDVNPVCDDECRDVGMLNGLQDYIDQQPHDILIVLHQMGSHGPAYYKRYPQEFEKFAPTCKTAELSNCSDEEIINAYDNTILYTDYFLSQVITLLKGNTQKFQTSMLYASDHGESLGENGLYLHGLPYAFAPDSQTHVPLIFWTDNASDIDIEATREQSQVANSHDAISKTLITLFEIESDVKFSLTPDLLKFKQDH